MQEYNGLTLAKNQLLSRERSRINIWCWVFAAPAMILFMIFTVYPILSSVWFSLIDWSGMTTDYEFVGLDNYKNLFTDSLYWNAFLNSFKFTLLNVPIQLVLSLVLAYTLNNKTLKLRNIYRTFYFLPVVTTAAIVGVIMIFIWGGQGPISVVLYNLEVIQKNMNFLGDRNLAMPTVVMVSIWKNCGIYMIYWLAGLQGIPDDVYEAAYVDGANRQQAFFGIVLPLLAPVAGVIAVLCTLNSLKIFDLIKTMTEGGPFYHTDVIATYVYRLAFSSEIGLPRLGYASAGAVLFGVVVIIMGTVLNSIKSRFSVSN